MPSYIELYGFSRKGLISCECEKKQPRQQNLWVN
jgi:hypothetical protein